MKKAKDPYFEKFKAEQERKRQKKQNAEDMQKKYGIETGEFLMHKWLVAPYCDGPMEVSVTLRHMTRDMSVGNVTRHVKKVKCKDMKAGVNVNIMGFNAFVHMPTPEYVDITCFERIYRVENETRVETDAVAIDNPYLSWEEVSFIFDYHHYSVYDRALKGVEVIRDWYRGVHPELNAKAIEIMKADVFKDLDILLDDEHMLELTLAKGLLQSCDNWGTMEIVDDGPIKSRIYLAILWKTYNYDEFWQVMMMAAKTNLLSSIIEEEHLDLVYDTCKLCIRKNENEYAKELLKMLIKQYPERWQ